MECAYCKEPFLESNKWLICQECKTVVCPKCADPRERKEREMIEKLKSDQFTRMGVLCPRCNRDMLFG